MSMIDAVKDVFSKYATFSGRARRSEYWYFCLATYLVNLVLGALTGLFPDGFLGTIFAGITTLFSLAIMIPSLAVTWRRLHDIGKGGGSYFIILVPLVGWILLLVWLCRDSQPGENRFGPNPKEIPVEPAPWEY